MIGALQSPGQAVQLPGCLAVRSLRSPNCLPSTSAPSFTGYLPQRFAEGRNGWRRSSRHEGLAVFAAIKKSSGKNVVCSKTVKAVPGSEKKVAEMCRDILNFSQGRANVKSSGILEFTCSQDQYEPGVYHFWERYDSNANMGRHNTSPEMVAFMNNVRMHLEGPIGLALYEWVDGKISNTCVQGGPKGEGGLDDATGAGGAGGASMKQTSAALDLGKVTRGDEGDAFGMGFKFPWQKKKKEKS